MAGQRPLLERAAAGDREAFARLLEDQVEGVYRYLLAWTGDRAEAADLTGQVFRDALGWLPATAGGEVEAGAWLIAMARDAVAQRRGSGWIAGPAGPEGPRVPATDAVAAVARLGDPEREVVVLRLLLGHSLAHTAHLSGYSRRAVLQLQLAACLTVWELTGGTLAGPTPATRAAPSAEEFERRLRSWEIDTTGSDPALADALAAAGSLRRAIPGYVVAPDDELVQRLGGELAAGTARAERTADNREHLPLGSSVDDREHFPIGSPVDNPAPGPPPWATLPNRGPQQPGVADWAARPLEHPDVADPAARALELREVVDPAASPSAVPPPAAVPPPSAVTPSAASAAEPAAPPPADPAAVAAQAAASRRHWVAIAVATTGIVVVLALQVFNRPAPSSGCGERPCPVPTTAAVAAQAAAASRRPPTTVVRSSTTGSTLRDLAPASTTPETSAATTPPTTRPPTSAVQTTGAPRPPTTTRAPHHDRRSADHPVGHDHDGRAGADLAATANTRPRGPSYLVTALEGRRQRRFGMWVDAEAEVRTRMRDRVQEAEHQRQVARARASRAGAGRPLTAYGWRLRQAAGFGLVRTGLRLLDGGRA
jgi:DNA-directed RNA polymerase specialized sigma24 family protein